MGWGSLNFVFLLAMIRGYLIDLTGVPRRAPSRKDVHLRALSRLREHIANLALTVPITIPV